MQPYDKGFYLRKEAGNNAFSWEQRERKAIYVAPFIKTRHFAITKGSEIAFAEVEEGREKNYAGLAEFLMLEEKNKNIYIFDNHNHGFYVIFKEVYHQKIPKGLPMIHFDQHKDMRKPPYSFAEVSEHLDEVRLFWEECYGPDGECATALSQQAFFYCNAVLNVGNFIVPMIEEGWISEAVMMDSSYALAEGEAILKRCPAYILDIDLDFFSEEMDYIPYERKVESIRRFLPGARLITICTSPYFVSFERAQRALYDILG